MGEIRKLIEKTSDSNARRYEWFRYEDIAPVSVARVDYETYSTIKIDKRDDSGEYVEIPLAHSDVYQRLWDPLRYMVLVRYVGSGRNREAIGQVVRKDVRREEIGDIKIAKDNNVEMY